MEDGILYKKIIAISQCTLWLAKQSHGRLTHILQIFIKINHNVRPFDPPSTLDELVSRRGPYFISLPTTRFTRSIFCAAARGLLWHLYNTAAGFQKYRHRPRVQAIIRKCPTLRHRNSGMWRMYHILIFIRCRSGMFLIAARDLYLHPTNIVLCQRWTTKQTVLGNWMAKRLTCWRLVQLHVPYILRISTPDRSAFVYFIILIETLCWWDQTSPNAFTAKPFVWVFPGPYDRPTMVSVCSESKWIIRVESCRYLLIPLADTPRSAIIFFFFISCWTSPNQTCCRVGVSIRYCCSAFLFQNWTNCSVALFFFLSVPFCILKI